MTTAKNRTDSRRDSRRLRRKASFLDLSVRPPDAVDLAGLQRLLGPLLFHFLLKLSRFMNGAGRCHPGLRALGALAGISKSTAGRRIDDLVGHGVITKTDPGGAQTARYQVTGRYFHAVLEGRLRFEPDWHEGWRKPGAAAAAFVDDCPADGTKGTSPDRELPSTEPSEPDAARAEGFQEVRSCPDDDIEVGEKPAASERSSNAPLHPRDAAARSAPRFHPVERRRPPDFAVRYGKPRLSAAAERENAKQLLAMKVARWIEARFRPGAVSDFWRAMIELPPDDAQIYFDRMVTAFRASGWEDRG